MTHSRRALPPLHQLLQRAGLRRLQQTWRREVVAALAREALAHEREFLAAGRGLAVRYGEDPPSRESLERALERRVLAEAARLSQPKLATVINATGVLLHTNLGRAQLSGSAIDAVRRVAASPVALEIDLERGVRGSRGERVERWLQLLTGAESALVVNNNAAALWLAVDGLARGKRAVISRGELVAIGGSFRMPDLLRATRARIVEVGTTNRTRLSDYDASLRAGDLVVKVHPSNYRIEGYTQAVEVGALAKLCRARGARLVFDAGSGCLYNFSKFGLEGEAPVDATLQAGADVVTFSGDKLLGGPQAGLIAGQSAAVRTLARHPMMRALRVDKLTLAALEATLAAYAASAPRPDLPLFDALALPTSVLRRRAKELAAALARQAPSGWSVTAGRAVGAVGGGSFAEQPVGGYEVAVAGPTEGDAQRLHDVLRREPPHVLTRIGDGRVRIDVRTPAPEQFETIADRVVDVWRRREDRP